VSTRLVVVRKDVDRWAVCLQISRSEVRFKPLFRFRTVPTGECTEPSRLAVHNRNAQIDARR
jgi:hypothetical protein